MTIVELQTNCPECRSSLIDDFHNGEKICSGCGLVAMEQMPDYGIESRATNPEEKMKLTRASGQTSYAQHDLGIRTEIAMGTKDFSGRTISNDVANQMYNLRKWQTRIRVASPEERRLANILAKIGETCNALALPRNVTESASMIYRNFQGQADAKGKSVACMSAATIYMACKQCDVVRSLDEICAATGSSKEDKLNVKLTAKYYRTLVMELGSKTAPTVTLEKYISKIANLAKLEVRVERLAAEIAEKTSDHSLADGKAPNGLAAAYLYIASTLLGQSILQRDVSSVAGITEVTIRNRCKEILTAYKIKVTLRQSVVKN
ncbi:Transcription initiation factor IIB [Nitrosotalea sinensis]|uniref:Transcription initiation factor IIB n=1 Tax=Nitrosotalea sinensis TaxID=1499975 RepID=A0A2H1EJ86_9ARCH|nr:TFIIB-type zinc ribbon-containing protein [Candidatus Nitrosotalea sinensis]SHO47992.1 Transcription initiation factor IIB [Candidatus Nitrosotalea sinensis]